MKKEILYYIFSILLLASYFLAEKTILNMMFFIILTIILIFFCKYQKSKNYLNGSIIRTIIIGLFLYFILINMMALITGFSRNIFNTELISIIKNITPIAIIVICQELIRYIYATKSKRNIKRYVFLTITLIILEIISAAKTTIFSNNEIIFNFICLNVLFAISTNFLYSYITYKVGYKPTLLMKLVLKTYMFILPILPNLGNYITSIINFLFPIILYVYISKIINKYEKDNKMTNIKNRSYIYAPIIIILVIMTLLTSGLIRYQLAAIASGSMEKVIYRGDAVLIDKGIEISELSIGDIIAYKHNNSLITHRIIGMDKKNNKYVFATKGDNNKNEDDIDIYEEDIVGKVIYNVKYIGFPTIKLNELFGKL